MKTTGLFMYFFSVTHVEHQLYMCDSVPLAGADARQCVSSTLLPRDRRDGSNFTIAYVPLGIMTAKVTLFFNIRKPLNRGMVVSMLVQFFCFSSICFQLFFICRSRTGQSC